MFLKMKLLCILILYSLNIISQNTTANFTSNIPNPTCVPLSIPFTNTSTNAISYSWTIDGTFFSDEEHPEKVFINAGSFEICLETIGQNNSIDSHCETITVFTHSNINFSTNANSGCAPLDVIFTTNGDNNITEWTWDFGDGNIVTTTENVITHTYLTSSIYDINLTATNIHGCITSITHTDAIDIYSDIVPQLIADNTNSCETPFTVNFSNTSTGNLSNVSYLWDFGDGQTSTEENPSITYTEANNYDVSLTITNNITECSNNTTIPNFIQIGADPMFSFSTENNNCNQVTTTFTNETPEEVVIFHWDFGDGNTSNLEHPIYTYSSVGCYTPSLTVTTTQGCVVTYDSPSCIEVIGDIELSYTTSTPTTACQTPLTVDFNTDYQGDISWNFGGQGNSTENNPSFTFTEFGIFPITLTATLPNGCQQTVTSTTIEIQAPVIDFQADIRSGCAPLTVNFQDISNLSDNISSWSWDFGNGETSHLQHPTYTYTEPGDYTVSLHIILENGCEGSISFQNYIEVGYIPPVIFEADPQETCIENIITFNEISGDENIDYWYWDFGDGSVSVLEQPLHEYNDTGWFDVKLIVGYNGCYDSLTVEDYMHLFPPKANFTYTQNCENPGAISFSDSSIGADEWYWDFGDGDTSTEQNPTHFYEENGLYIVTLQVYNQETECYDDLVVGISVQMPKAEFEINPQHICITPGQSATFSVNNTSQNAVDYNWFVPGAFVILENSSDIHPDIVYNSPGIYTGMQLTAIDINGCQDVFIFEDTLIVDQITTQFSFENIDANCNQIFQFTDESQSLYSNIVAWEWNFGDGLSSSEQHPTHTYGESGTYFPSLTVTNALGCSQTYTSITPVNIESPFVSFTTEENICLGDTSFFNNASIASEFINWEWNFGDNTNSNDWQPTYHVFTEGGTYQVCFSATNADGCSGIDCKNIIVEEIEVDFSGDDLTASCNPHIVQFTDLSINATAWEWDFGDNTGISTLQNPAHTYTNSGNFTVCLTITSQSGCQQTICKENYIQVEGPTATVTYDPNNGGCLDFNVNFNVNGQNIDSYILDFGDGENESDSNISSNIFSVEHTYTSLGEFAPILLLSDDAGCNNFITLDTIYTETMSLDFTSSQNNFCTGTHTDFSSLISTTGNIQSVEWFFEGATPSTSSQLNPSNIIYNNGGDFDVTLTVHTEFCTETIVKEDFIHILPSPELSFSPTPSSHCGPTNISFTNTSDISSGNISNWSWNFGDGETSTDEHPIHYFSDTGSYIITLTATSDQGCTSQITQSINIYEPAFADILLEDYTLCQNQNIQLETELVGSPSWSPNTGLSCYNCPNPVANPNQTTTYYVTATTPDGCMAMDSITIERIEQAAPIVTISNDTTICQGDIIQIVATGGNSPFDYSWDTSTEGLSCYENCSNPLVQIDQTSTFTVSVSNEYGCITSKSVTINVIGNGVDITGPDRTICLGDSITLSIIAGTNPSWENHPTLSCNNCENPIASPTETTTYTVSVQYQNCTLSQDITIYVMSPDDIFAGEDQNICRGQPITLEGDADGDIAWSINGNIFETDNLNPEVYPNNNSTYVLSVVNDLCTLSDSVFIEVHDKVEIQVEDIEACPGEILQLEAYGDEITNYQWYPNDALSNENIPNPTIIVEESTSFTVVGSSEFCQADTATLQVTIADAPLVILPHYQSFVPGNSVTLGLSTDDDGTYTYQWSPNQNISCTDCPNPTVSPDTTTVYTVVVTNAQGCVNTDEILLKPLLACIDDIIIVPTGFSPNGDGHNDLLKPLGLAELQLFRVYNRWGELIFETTNSSESWDGSFKSKPVNTDVYVWYLEAICPIDGSIITKKGDVTLVR